MFDGDIRSFTCRTREEAILKAIELIGDDSAKCATICKRYRSYTVYFKDVMSSQPADNDNNGTCQTLFLKT